MAEAKITLSAVDQTANAFSALRGRLSAIGGEAAALSTRFGGLGAAVAGALSIGGLGAFFGGVTRGLDALNDLKDATGASIGNISALEDVAARTGSSFETVGTSLIKLNQALQNAKPGDDASNALKAIGLDAEKLRAVDPAEALQQIAVAFSQFADDGNKARATQILFGKSLSQVAPLLNDLARAGKLNATVTEEQAQAAEIFSNRLAVSQKNLTDLGRTIVSGVLPGLVAVQEAFGSGAREGERFAGVAGFVRTAFEAVAVLGANVAFVFGGMGREIVAIAAQAAALARGDLEGFSAISDAVKEDGKRARAELDDLERRIMGLGSSNAGAGRGSVNPAFALAAQSIGQIKANVKAAESEFDKYIQRLQAAQLATVDLTAVEQARVDIALGKLGKLTEAQRGYVLSVAATLDTLKAKDPLGDFIKNLDDGAVQKVLDKINQLADQSTAAKFDAIANSQDQVIQAFAEGRISAETYSRAMQVLGDNMDALVPKLEKVGKEVDEFSRQAARNIQDALGETIFQSLSGKFDSIGDLWKNLLKRMVAQAAASQLAESLFGKGYGTTTNQFGGLVGMLIGAFSGSGGVSGARANGGPVTAGRAYLVGERGPEIMVPRTSGTVLPNGTTMGGGASVVVNVNGDATERSARRTAMAVRMALAEYDAARG